MKFSLLFVVLLIISSVVAADGPIEELTVEGRDTNLLGYAISSSEGFVGQREIRLRPLSRPGDLMELVPGMVATQHSGSGKANQYFLRGFNLDHGTDFATFVDGMPVNMRTHGHGQGYTDINFIIPEIVENLAYKKGTYYADVGDFSSAGSAFFSTASQLDRRSAGLTWGEENYRRALLSGSESFTTNQHFLYALELQAYDGPWSDIEEDVEKTNMLLKHTQKLAEGQLSLGLMAYDNTWNSADQIPQRAVDSGLIDQFGSIDTTVGGDSQRYSINAIYDSENIHISAYLIDYEMQLYSNFSYFIDSVNGDQFEQLDKRIIWGGNAHWHVNQPRWRQTLGVDLRVDDIEEVGLFKTVERRRRGPVRFDEVQQWSASAYWQNELRLSQRLRATLGLRYDFFDFDVDNLIDVNINNVDVSANGGQTDDDILSLKGSLTYRLGESTELYVAGGQGFHSNDARGTVTRIDPEDGSAISPVDPLVSSEGYELGLRAYLNNRVNVSAALWYLELDSELLFVGDAGNTEATRASERQGFELALYYNINDIWTLDIEYAYTDAEFSDTDPTDPQLGDEIPGALEDVIQAGISADFTNGLYGSVRARYFGEEPLEENGEVRGDSTTIVNFLVGRAWSAFGLDLEVINLLDSDDRDIEYFYESRLVGEADPIDDIHFHVLEPRALRLTAQFNF